MYGVFLTGYKYKYFYWDALVKKYQMLIYIGIVLFLPHQENSSARVRDFLLNLCS